MVSLVPMDHNDFIAYTASLNRDYAASHVAARNWDSEGAEERAAAATRKLLPADERTPHHHLLHIESDGERVGVLWYRLEPYRDGVEIFVLDIEIYRAHRRRGFAKATLSHLQAVALREGATRIRLHVFADNHSARTLYHAFGFVNTDIWLAKSLARDSAGTQRGPANRSDRPALRLETIDAQAFGAFRAKYLDTAAAAAAVDTTGWGSTPVQVRAADARRRADQHLRSTLPLGAHTPNQTLAQVRNAASGALIGSLWYGPVDANPQADIDVRFLCVEDAQRGRGFGRAILDRVELLSRQTKAKRLTAGVTAGNPAALALFAAAGFQQSDLWMAFEVPMPTVATTT